MQPIVAVIAPGMMGSAVGQRLVENGIEVRTSLAGRSEATLARAKAAGMVGVSDEQIAASDIILSILPPGDALGLAERLAPGAARRGEEADLRRLQRARSGDRAAHRARGRRKPAPRSSMAASSAGRRSRAPRPPRSTSPARRRRVSRN